MSTKSPQKEAFTKAELYSYLQCHFYCYTIPLIMCTFVPQTLFIAIFLSIVKLGLLLLLCDYTSRGGLVGRASAS